MINARIEKLNKIRTDNYLGRIFHRLRPDEQALCIRFVQTHASASHADFQRLAHSLFMDKPKPKNWVSILEILDSCTRL